MNYYGSPKDLVSNLRDFARLDRGAECLPQEHDCWLAADEIERLRGVVDEIQKATLLASTNSYLIRRVREILRESQEAE